MTATGHTTLVHAGSAGITVFKESDESRNKTHLVGVVACAEHGVLNLPASARGVAHT